ncbi:MAG: hypothetical protein IT233_12685 [Bacteroidia bacterium]|nr:hypothetical protein [Bacteroidia bacterium]
MRNKTIAAYLKELADKIRLAPEEHDKIETSIKALKDKLILAFFDDGLTKVKRFGSYDRETLLTRKVDSESDVDLLITFDERKWEPQTYLSKLKKFAEDNYPRSDKYQDHPTIVIELNHIKFELTPCVYTAETSSYYEKYAIPKRTDAGIEWIKTEPDDLKKRIAEFTNTKGMLIDLILIFKYWNVINGSVYQTLPVENWMLKCFDQEEGIEYNVFHVIDRLNYSNSDIQNELNRKTKQMVENIELLLEKGMDDYAQMELKKIFPMI